MEQKLPFSSLSCDRGAIKTREFGSRSEASILVSARVAPQRQPHSKLYDPSPTVVGIVFTDICYQSIHVMVRDYERRQLVTNSNICGIILSSKMVWGHLEIWKNR